MKADEAKAKVLDLPDEDLIRIAHSKEEEGYHSELVAAAKDELLNRRLQDKEVESVKADADRTTEFLGKEDLEPLSNGVFLCFAAFGWALLFSLPAIAILYFTGYKTKAKQAFGGIIFGLFCWGVLTGVLSIIF